MLRAIAAAAVLAAAAVNAAAEEVRRVPSGDYPTIQDALDGAPNNTTILVGPGTWSGGIVVTGIADLRIRGIGKPVIEAGSAESAIDVHTAALVTITGFTLRGGIHGIYVEDASGLVVQGVSIEDTSGSAVLLDGAAGPTFRRCRISGSASHGIEDLGSGGPRVDRCVIEDVDGDGIRITPDDGAAGSPLARITGNTVSSDGVGIRFGGTDGLLSRNRVSGGEYGILVTSATVSTGTVVERNRVTAGGGVSLKVETGGVTASRNLLPGGALFMGGPGGDLVADRNVVRGGVFGVYVDASGGAASATGNRVTDSGAFGVRTNGTGGTIARNVVAGTGQEGISVSNTDASVDRNRVSGAADYGLILNGTGCTVTGNRVHGSPLLDCADANAEGVNTYEGNSFGTQEFEVF